jgi:hypothetical protein
MSAGSEVETFMTSDQMNLPRGLQALIMLVAVVIAPTLAAGEPAAAAARPDPPGQATRVSVGIYVVDVPEIDDAERTFTVDVYLILRWKDPRLASSDSPGRSKPLLSVWHPDSLILNQRSMNRLLPEVVVVDQEGHVEYRQRLQGKLSVSLNLRNFPLDQQDLVVRFVSPGLPPGELDFVPDERGGRSEHFSISDWTIAPPAIRADPLVMPDGREVAGFSCVLVAQRRAVAYFYQFIIPLTFIVCMSWAACWMVPEQLGPRQGIAVTSMLTIIAYRFVVVNQLPRVAYLTRFDYLLLGCTTLVFLVLVEVVAAHRLMTQGHPERAWKLDMWSRGVFPALYLLLILAASLL